MTHRIGAILYLLWGALHLLAAAEAFRFAQTLDPDLVQGRLMQNSWNLAFLSLVAVGVAATMNWKNSRPGYWINLLTVSAADIGFIVFVLQPGYIPMWPGILGPVLWISAAIMSTLGISAARPPQAR